MLHFKEVLVVDDRVEIRRLIQEALSQLQVERVDAACSGKEALDKVSGYSYDLVLLDLKLMDINGLEVLSSIKKEKPEIKVILISGEEDRLMEKAEQMGADGFLNKPFNLHQLFQALGIDSESPVNQNSK